MSSLFARHPVRWYCDWNDCCHGPLVRGRTTRDIFGTACFLYFSCVNWSLFVSSRWNLCESRLYLFRFFCVKWSQKTWFSPPTGPSAGSSGGASGGPSGGTSLGPPRSGGGFFGSLRSPDFPADLPTKVNYYYNIVGRLLIATSY